MRKERVLIFRTGSIGDTLVAVPAFCAIRRQFPTASITLLCDQHPTKGFGLVSEVLAGSGLFDDVLLYPVGISPWNGPLSILRGLRQGGFGTLVYLLGSGRSRLRVERDKIFFSIAGIRRFVGTRGFYRLPKKQPGTPLARVPWEGELLLNRLRASGVSIPPQSSSAGEIGLGPSEEMEVSNWLVPQPNDGGRVWMSVGPGGKQPVHRWPTDRYLEVMRTIINEFDVWPVVLGGAEDYQIGQQLIAAWKRGYNAAGKLGVRAAMSAMRRCRLHLGNDTGTIHMAAAMNVPCVGVYSSTHPPGQWEPFGPIHRVLRSSVECEGCGLQECRRFAAKCILAVTVADVAKACSEALRAFGLTLKSCAHQSRG